jgi:hypothetical protein
MGTEFAPINIGFGRQIGTARSWTILEVEQGSWGCRLEDSVEQGVSPHDDFMASIWPHGTSLRPVHSNIA